MSRFGLREPRLTASIRTEVVDGLSVGLRVVGSPGTSGPVFVLVHGIGVSMRYYRPLAERLAEHGAVYLVDMPGYGSQRRPNRDVSISDHADVLARVLEREDIIDPVLVGHSMGAQIVSDLAARHPHVSDRIVLLGPTLMRGERTLLRSALRLGLDMLREPVRANAIVVSDYLLRCRPPWYLAQLPHLLRDRMEDRMESLTGRVLVVRGDKDPVVNTEWARTLADLAPYGRVEEVPGAHVIMYTAPDELARLILAHSER
ncbi:alpha/beta fold hydrolase [Planctomonas psychrotolerans]|uniref:alpha/beta fold hydrolase n=1 Tax=Planctomonas psychrotolerans TaxID=2528712 RepID=UPI00123B7F52|nr:alpha/beta hydrolase [Planctomonas psychrotolerans]